MGHGGAEGHNQLKKQNVIKQCFPGSQQDQQGFCRESSVRDLVPGETEEVQWRTAIQNIVGHEKTFGFILSTMQIYWEVSRKFWA